MKEEYATQVSPMSERLVAYCWSLSPYFNDPSQVNPGLLRLKVKELLYNVMDCSKNIFRQMLQLRQPVKTDIHRVVEENCQRLTRCYARQASLLPMSPTASASRIPPISAASSSSSTVTPRRSHK